MSRFGRYSENWTARHWPAVRARGFRHFLLFRGLLIWGGLMFVAMAIVMTFRFSPSHPRYPLVIGIAALLCATGGPFWGAITWFLNERIYRALQEEDKT